MIPLSLFDEPLAEADVEPAVMDVDWITWSVYIAPSLFASPSADIVMSRWAYLFEE